LFVHSAKPRLGEPRGVSPRVGVPRKFRFNSRVSLTRRLTPIGSPESWDANVRNRDVSMEFAVGRPVNRPTTTIWRMHRGSSERSISLCSFFVQSIFFGDGLMELPCRDAAVAIAIEAIEMLFHPMGRLVF
jgi:hypothetical protein